MEKYDINTYSEEELFEIVGYSDPENEDLEKILIESLHNYRHARSQHDVKMFTFLKNIYTHFFDAYPKELEDDELKKNNHQVKVKEKQSDHKPIGAYDVTTFTDKELRSLLDISETATARETEAKLIQMLQLYKDTKTEQGQQKFTFYKNIYNHFFYDAKNETIETEPSTKKDDEQVNFTQKLDYTKGKINPILKETYKRIISIDSQYRDAEYLSATDFTLNITETLKDVVSLKLYAVQIPVTWYTISNSYGSNYFLLKPINANSTMGIYNNTAHEYRVEIDPGNYTQTTLTAQIKSKLDNLNQIYTDVSFGSTTFLYEPANAKSTLVVDIQKVYNESYYNMHVTSKIKEILNMQSYDVSINSIYSDLFQHTTSGTQIPYIVDSFNNTVTIEHYLDSNILNTISIKLDLGSSKTIEQIVADLNTKLATNTNLNASSINLIGFPGNKWKYQWNIYLNRYTAKNVVDSKLRLLFPNPILDPNMADTGRILWQNGLFFPSADSIIINKFKFTDISMSQIFEMENEKITFYPKYDINGGVYIKDSSTNDIVLNVNNGSYNVSTLTTHIQELIDRTPLLYGTVFSLYSSYVIASFNINKVYTTKDYRIVFYDIYSFTKCTRASNSYRNATADTTLGYILGFKELVEYNLTSVNDYAGVFLAPDLTPTNSKYTYMDNENNGENLIRTKITLEGDSVLSIYLYNYFMIILDDFNQNHLNDGLVTVSKRDTSVTLPSYANRKSQRTCDTSAVSTFSTKGLTEKQVYSVEQILETQNKSKDLTNAGPFIKDMFALLPIKASGVETGAIYVEFGGTLQQQERVYFGPVNINRLMVKLINDKGDVVDLNGANWSFQLVCEQLYQKGGDLV